MQRSDKMKDFIQPQGVLPLGQDTCELVAKVFIIAIIDPFRTEDIEKLLSQQKSHLVNASSKRRIRNLRGRCPPALGGYLRRSGQSFRILICCLFCLAKERTRAEWEALYQHAGLEIRRITQIPDAVGTSLVEGIKRGS